MIEKGRKWKLSEVLKMSIEICTALEFIHSNNIMHRDMNPGNFLLSEGFEIKLTDFGLSKEINDASNTAFVGAELFRAPEADTKTYNNKCDIWSLAVIIAYIITNGKLEQVSFESNDERKLFINQVKAEYPGEKSTIEDMQDAGISVIIYLSRRESCLKCCLGEFECFKEIFLYTMKLDDNARPSVTDVKLKLKGLKKDIVNQDQDQQTNIKWFLEEYWKKF
eukprot:TRINITY_DN3569_c3_g1_i1.p1 TRINITY_DN3569_c3_g1~~TRINITY_DN3569_c3_g1_i1.p1  ORF type:complete len:222 (-),score=39.54 TRINITY_DN3569_c3_g1_i1:288-953(-)